MTYVLDECVSRMRNVGDQLVPYNFPQADPKLEDDLNLVKTKELFVDGYQVVLHFSKADYKTHFIETVQILGKNSPFLPFNLVSKIARKFLGSSNLCLVEIFRENRKIYCWTVASDRSGKPIPHPNDTDADEIEHEGFKFQHIDSNQVNFY